MPIYLNNSLNGDMRILEVIDEEHYNCRHRESWKINISKKNT